MSRTISMLRSIIKFMIFVKRKWKIFVVKEKNISQKVYSLSNFSP